MRASPSIDLACRLLFILSLGMLDSGLWSLVAAHFPLRSANPDPYVYAQTGFDTRRERPGTSLRQATPAQFAYTHGDPTADEQLMLELINRARATPATEGQRLAATQEPSVLAAYRFFQVDLDKVVADFATYPARWPLAFNPALITASRLHSLDMARHDFQGHTGTTATTPSSRVEAAGYKGWTGLAENVFAYAQSIFDGHAGLLVDWGVPTLGHRRNLLNYEGPQYTEIGIGIELDPNFDTEVGPVVVTQDLGQRGNAAFLVGVVFRDGDGDAFYTPGEGVPGIKVVPSQGSYYAVTSQSGGYALPLTNPHGSLDVTMSGPGLPTDVTRSVTLSGTSAKLDLDMSQLPPAVTTLALLPGSVTRNPAGQVSFTAQAPAGARFVIEFSSDLQSWQLLGTFTGVASGVLVTDTTAAEHRARLYRGRWLP